MYKLQRHEGGTCRTQHGSDSLQLQPIAHVQNRNGRLAGLLQGCYFVLTSTCEQAWLGLAMFPAKLRTPEN